MIGSISSSTARPARGSMVGYYYDPSMSGRPYDRYFRPPSDAGAMNEEILEALSRRSGQREGGQTDPFFRSRNFGKMFSPYDPGRGVMASIGSSSYNPTDNAFLESRNADVSPPSFTEYSPRTDLPDLSGGRMPTVHEVYDINDRQNRPPILSNYFEQQKRLREQQEEQERQRRRMETMRIEGGRMPRPNLGGTGSVGIGAITTPPTYRPVDRYMRPFSMGSFAGSVRPQQQASVF